MKAIGAFGFFLLFLAAIALVNLRNIDPGTDNDVRAVVAKDLDSSHWRLAAMRDAAGAANAGIEIRFAHDGSVMGGGACHGFASRYQLTDDMLIFLDTQLSPPRCAGDAVPHEPALVKLLAKTAYAETDGAQLVLLAADGTRLVRFRKITER